MLRRAGLVTTRRVGSTVYYSLTSPQLSELLAAARVSLATVLSDQVELLEDLRADSRAVDAREAMGKRVGVSPSSHRGTK